ncbi:MAG: hypothetical protein K2Q20_07690, partial [Phycisphaerales bacterium]|nr:hypothetical protein [Phycisphaerales bacterium]
MMTIRNWALNAMRLVLVAAFMVLLVPISAVRAQSPAAWVRDQSVQGVIGSVQALAVMPGGDVIVGGKFTTAGGASANNIARYNASKRVWSSLGSGVGGNPSIDELNALAVLPGGDVIVGGLFTTAGGVAVSNIARYNPSTNTWSALGSGTDSTVLALAVLPGGDVIVGGGFTAAGGVAANKIARYSPTTGVWSALGSGTDEFVGALAVLPGGDLIVGGGFTTAGGVSATRIARYNPTTGAWSALGSGTSGSRGDVRALAVRADGDLIVGGEFTSAGGVPASGIARYNSSTGVWSALGKGVEGLIFAVAALPGGDVMVAGSPPQQIARYNPARDTWFAPKGVEIGHIAALAISPDGSVFVGGRFDSVGGLPADNVALYNATTGGWSALGRALNGEVSAMAVVPTGDVIVGGRFTIAGGIAANNIVRFDPTAGVWSALGRGLGGTDGRINVSVNAIAVLPDGDIVVGGSFDTAGDIKASNIARYNPTTAVWSALGRGTDNAVRALLVLPGGDVIV